MSSALQRFADRLTRLERNLRAASSSPQLGTSSIENGGAIKDRGPDGTTYQFIGRQFDGTHTVSQINGPVPPAPTFPGASPAYNSPGMVVSWDGMFENGAFGPMDLLRVDVHVLDEDHTDPLLYAPAGTLLAGAGGSVSVFLDPGDYWAVLVAWTTSGKYAISGASNMVTVVAPTIELPPASDGEAPTEAPVVSGHAFAVGAVEFVWPAITSNEDPIVYEYWASTTSPVSTAGPALGFVPQPNVRISKINGVQVPMDGTPVYIKVAARDADGLGPMSAEASATAIAPEVEQIIAGMVAALEIEASQIRGQFISADLALLSMLQVGDRLDINGADSTITIYAADLDEDGNKVPLIILDPVGSEFRGRVIADDISVMNGLILKGQMSQIASDSGVMIMSGVADPSFGPSLSSTPQTSIWPAVPTGFEERGIAWDSVDGVFLRLLVSTDAADRDGTTRLERINPDTAAVDWVKLANIPGYVVDDFNSVCRSGDYYYTMSLNTGDGWSISRFNALGMASGSTAAHIGTGSVAWLDQGHRPAVGHTPAGSTSPLVTAAWSDGDSFITIPGIYAKFRNADGSHHSYAGPGLSAPIEASSSGGKSLLFVERRNEGADNNLYIGGSAQLRRYRYDSGDGAFEYVANSAITLNASSTRGGVAGKTSGADQGFYSVQNGGSVKYRYSQYVPATNEKLWVTFANTDGTFVTKDSPASSIAVPAGRYVQISLPPDSLSAKIYTSLGITLPPDAGMLERSVEVLTASRTMLIDPSVGAAGPGTPPAANTFPGGLAGWIRSQSGGFEVDGAGHLEAPLKMQAGSVQVDTLVSGEWASTDVVFPVPFDTIPIVVATVASSALGTSPNWISQVARVSDITPTGVKVWMLQTNNSSTRTVNWMAMVP